MFQPTVPLFSVLIANYNNGNYIQDAIDSVLAQTYTNWEVIIVDDASTDNSINIYNKYKGDKRFHIYSNETNQGCGYTKRRCVELANGIICGFLDPDDALYNNALDVMVSEHNYHPNASLIYSRYERFDQFLQQSLGISTQQKQIPDEKSFLEVGHGAISQFATFKTIYYKKTYGINEYCKRAVDHNLYLLLEEVGQTIFIDQVLYKYRTDTGSNISLGFNSYKAYLWSVHSKIEACERRHILYSIETFAFNNLESILEGYAEDRIIEESAKIRNSKTYRVGKAILKPLKLFKKMFGFC